LDGFSLYPIALAILLVLSAFFSSSEAALFSLSRAQVSRLSKQSPAGRQVAAALAAPRKLLVTILIGNLLVNVFWTSAATSLAIGLFGERGVGIAFAIMSVMIIAFGEIFPKVLALNNPRQFARFAIYPLRVLQLVFYPVSMPVTRLADGVIELLKKRLGRARRHFLQDELVTALEMGRKEGQDFEYDLLSNIIEFRETTVKEVMTPSIEVFSLPLTMARDEMEERASRSRFSRFPVYGETADDSRGIVHIKDLAAASESATFDINGIIRSPYYVPESTRIKALFKEMIKQRIHMAIVIDEYGSYVGLVTMEDILEELVGEIRDAKESNLDAYVVIDKDRIVVPGIMEIDEFNQAFNAGIVDDEHATIAGYVLGATGRIPREGETIDIAGLRFHIISAQPNRIRKLRVERL
jgi:putative hemolysin